MTAQQRGVAIVGASERTLWTYWLISNLKTWGYDGAIYPVNRNHDTIFGVRSVSACSAIEGIVDIGVVAVRTDDVEIATRELLDAGAKLIVVISSGFKESGTDSARQAELNIAAECAAAGVRLLGPNCVGYADLAAGICALAEPVPEGLSKGPIGVLSHSGAGLSAVLESLHLEDLGISRAYSLGNGAGFDLADGLNDLAADRATTVVCGLVEGLVSRSRMEDALIMCRDSGKHVVVLLLGGSDQGRRIAASHTGAIIGDQQVAKTWLRDHGVTVVSSIPELARAANLLARVDDLKHRGDSFILTSSGGGAGLGADFANRFHVPLATIGEKTTEQLGRIVPPGMSIGNPLDVVAGMSEDSQADLYRKIASDPGVGLLIEPYTMTWPDQSEGRSWHRRGLERLASASAAVGAPLIISSIHNDQPSEWARSLQGQYGAVVTAGLQDTMAALGSIYASGTRVSSRRAVGQAPSADRLKEASRVVIGEADARPILEAAGVPVVPGVVADTATEAALAAESLAGPWVAKLILPGLGHKHQVGGVIVGLRDRREIELACKQMSERVGGIASVSAPRTVRYLVEQMDSGAQVMVSCTRDPIIGAVLAITAGDWAAEAFAPLLLLPEPITKDVIRAALSDHDFDQLLGPNRAAGLATFASQLSHQFVDGLLRPYEAVECNPVIVGAEFARAADALLILQREPDN